MEAQPGWDGFHQVKSQQAERDRFGFLRKQIPVHLGRQNLRRQLGKLLEKGEEVGEEQLSLLLFSPPTAIFRSLKGIFPVRGFRVTGGELPAFPRITFLPRPPPAWGARFCELLLL